MSFSSSALDYPPWRRTPAQSNAVQDDVNLFSILSFFTFSSYFFSFSLLFYPILLPYRTPLYRTPSHSSLIFYTLNPSYRWKPPPPAPPPLIDFTISQHPLSYFFSSYHILSYMVLSYLILSIFTVISPHCIHFLLTYVSHYLNISSTSTLPSSLL